MARDVGVTPAYLALEKKAKGGWPGTGQVAATLTDLGDGDSAGVEFSGGDFGHVAGGIEGDVDRGAVADRGCQPGQVPVGEGSQRRRPVGVLVSEVLGPYSQIELVIEVEVRPGSGEQTPPRCAPEPLLCDHVTVSGGGSSRVSVHRPVTISEGPVPFGLQDNELALEGKAARRGAPDTRAGSHPFQVTSTLVFNQVFRVNPNGEDTGAGRAGEGRRREDAGWSGG